MRWRRLRRVVLSAAALLLAVVVLAPEAPAFGDRDFQLSAIVQQDRRFDFLVWQVSALGAKARGILDPGSRSMAGDEQKRYVLETLDLIAQAQRLAADIEQVYVDPVVDDPAAATAARQAELDHLRATIDERQSVMEAIVQRQVSDTLAAEGITGSGFAFPPVLMHMTPLPLMLIVSPRDRIEQVAYASLIPTLSTDEKDSMEDDVFNRLDLSALVVPIGGLGMYPSMVRETSDIRWLAEVTAHEWMHHWLAFRPLGVRYLASPEMRTINETVASIVEQEIGPAVIRRYYPELAPAEPAATSPEQTPPPDAPYGPPYPLPFDFSYELGLTRLEVDRLLSEGRVEEAEAYMEERRELFVAHGHRIRKLNQAFFAFYGGYAAEPGGASAGDPIGPMLREIRAASPSLRAFLDRVARVTSYDDLRTLYEEVTGQDPAAVLNH